MCSSVFEPTSVLVQSLCCTEVGWCAPGRGWYPGVESGGERKCVPNTVGIFTVSAGSHYQTRDRSRKSEIQEVRRREAHGAWGSLSPPPISWAAKL